MTLDDCIVALRATDDVPKAALAAGMAHAATLAPTIYALAEKFCRGVYLLPADSELLFNGLHILAAAKHPELVDHLLALARQPSDDLNLLFADHAPTCLTRLLLSVWDREPAALMHLIEHADMGPDAKWALFDVLARLTFDGGIARPDTVAFLARIERDNLIDPGHLAWWGWEQAVVRLGITGFEPALQRVWKKPVYDQHDKRDHDAMLGELQRAAATQHGDASIFDAADIRPITDPVEAMAWIERRAETLAKLRAEDPPLFEDAPAESERLTESEREWLRGLLVSRQVPESALPFEALDGFMTALVIGPALVPPSEYLPEMWGTADGSGPAWDSAEQAEYAMGLLMKHWNAIAARRMADAPHRVEIEYFGIAHPGEDWAQGFLDGMEMRAKAWEPFFLDRRAVAMPRAPALTARTA